MQRRKYGGGWVMNSTMAIVDLCLITSNLPHNRLKSQFEIVGIEEVCNGGSMGGGVMYAPMAIVDLYCTRLQ